MTTTRVVVRHVEGLGTVADIDIDPDILPGSTDMLTSWVDDYVGSWVSSYHPAGGYHPDLRVSSVDTDPDVPHVQLRADHPEDIPTLTVLAGALVAHLYTVDPEPALRVVR